MKSQSFGRGVQGPGQAALHVGAEQARPFAGLVKAPTLAGHPRALAGLGLAQPAFAAQAGEGVAQPQRIFIRFKTSHLIKMIVSAALGERRNRFR